VPVTPPSLKLSWLDEETRDEPVALSTWHGDGAVLLLESDASGVMLLERLDSDRMLDDEPIDFAVETAGRLLRRLAVPAPAGLRRTMRGEASRSTEQLPATWDRLGRPLPRALLETAVELCRTLGPEAGSLLVNDDLHYENVLAGTRDVAGDRPEPVAGDLEFGVIPLLWNRMKESLWTIGSPPWSPWPVSTPNSPGRGPWCAPSSTSSGPSKPTTASPHPCSSSPSGPPPSTETPRVTD
jgi:streptomycin 6-kinase